MKKNPWIIPVATLVVGAAGGFISGRNSGSEAAPAASAEVRNSRASGRSTALEEEAKKAASRAKSMEDALDTPGHSARIKSLIDYYGTLTPEQLAEEAKRLDNLPMGERIMASLLLFGRWAEVDPTGAMAHANTMGFAAAFVRPTILQSWASVDPENAAKYYSENPREFSLMGGGGPGGQNGAATIAAEWAKQDPQAALAWASSLNGDDKNRAMTSVIREVAMTDPKKAAELAQSMSPAERGDAYESIARSYGAKNFDEAEAWVKSLPADQQADAMASAIAGLAQNNPELALTKAMGMAEGDEKNRAIRNSLENLSKTNPTKALAEVAKLDAEAQRRAIEPVISNFVVSDPAAAESYVKGLQAGPVRDNAVAALVRGSTGDPATLMP
ncbi:MAG TPA: hypothetical protein VM511_11190, partial [Luteolibacter sp.]|nr:hypothetical protein [Luteolibacter sp.]